MEEVYAELTKTQRIVILAHMVLVGAAPLAVMFLGKYGMAHVAFLYFSVQCSALNGNESQAFNVHDPIPRYVLASGLELH